MSAFRGGGGDCDHSPVSIENLVYTEESEAPSREVGGHWAVTTALLFISAACRIINVHLLTTQAARVIIWPSAIKSKMLRDLVSYVSSILLSSLLQAVCNVSLYMHMDSNLFSLGLWQPQLVRSTILPRSSNIVDVYLWPLSRWPTAKAAATLTHGTWLKRICGGLLSSTLYTSKIKQTTSDFPAVPNTYPAISCFLCAKQNC